MGVRSLGMTWRSAAMLPSQRRSPSGVAASRSAAASAAASLTRTLPDRYSGAGINRSVALSGSANTSPVRACRVSGSLRPRRRATSSRLNLAVGVQADRDGVGRGVCAEAGGAGCDHPPGHDRGFAGGAGGGVEVFQCVDTGGVRVEFKPALWWRDAGEPVLAGGRVNAAGAPIGDPVDRSPPLGVGVVAGVELPAQPVDMRGILDRSGLGGQQRHSAVTQPEQGGEFAGLAGRDPMFNELAVDDDAEPAVVGHLDVAVLVLGRGVGPQHPVGGRCGGAGAEHGPGRLVAGGVGQFGVQAGAQLERDVDVAGGLDLQLRAELARPDAGRADDPVGMGNEVLVDADLPVGVAADRYGAGPPVASPGPSAGSRRRSTSTSVITWVPAARWCADIGSRTAATRSAMATISRRAAGLVASIV